MRNMLQKVGWKKDFIEKNVPFMPISGWMGDNLLKKSDNDLVERHGCLGG
jgi:elongation factor 1-alpha